MNQALIQPLRATLRLQFHKGFTLEQAVPLVPYFARLGISHIYASPLLAARAGSMHGYDVVDPTQVNPELGGEPALRRLVSTLREHDMGLILDIVSNHMAVGGSDNPWWLDLLEWGRLSPYGEFFDIQWHSPDPLMEGQLLLPFLGSDYGVALQEGTLKLLFKANTGSFYVEHYDHHFPICPSDYGEILKHQETLKSLADRFSTLSYQTDAHSLAMPLKEELRELASDPQTLESIHSNLQHFDSTTEAGFQALHQLLERQSYRLASWRTAADDINWRRFFDINELGGLRVERPAVFEATHGKIFQLIAEGLVDGLRIDHIDGLADPRGYCRKLHQDIAELNRNGISVEYLAFPRMGLGSKDYTDMISVWCAADRRQDLTNAKRGGSVPTKNCTNPVAMQYALGQQLGVNGTPAIFAPDGTQLGGYLPPAQLRAALDKLSEKR